MHLLATPNCCLSMLASISSLARFLDENEVQSSTCKLRCKSLSDPCGCPADQGIAAMFCLEHVVHVVSPITAAASPVRHGSDLVTVTHVVRASVLCASLG